jgi:CHASE2 domain-containing sensor protein
MKLLRAEPSEGLGWIRRAFQVFLTQPFGLAGLFSFCALAAFVLAWIPVIGGALLPVLAPAGSLVFMLATRRAWPASGRCPARSPR